jgi:cell division protein FtsI (penicillin-binding protein 3)
MEQTLYSSDKQLLSFTIQPTAPRSYPQHDTLQPLLGYTTPSGKGLVGLEEGLLKDYDHDADIILTINLSLQRKIEKILDAYKHSLQVDDIIVAVMESGTGKVRVMASSNRYDPNHITKADIPTMHQKFSTYPYEPGAVMMPLVLAAAFEKGYLDESTLIHTNNGKYELDNGRFITDSSPQALLSPEGILHNVSNIGIAKVASLFSGVEFRKSLEYFGLADRTTIELKRGKPGFIHSSARLTEKMYRGNTAYGYGMLATFTQLLQAYSVFNNEGKRVSPTLIASVHNREEGSKPVQVISSANAQKIHNMLVANVQRGLEGKAKVESIETGGMPATAYIYRNGKYRREYHSSFYGFANDAKGNRYTIGVLVIRVKAPEMFYASRSAVPVFREVVEVLFSEKRLAF